MFKKPLADIKTTAPLRTSDRRKLKQRVLDTFSGVLQPEDGDVIVPEGLHYQKFTNYAGEPGTAYFSLEGDPLWFTIGKDSDDLIPTIYTLWKRPNLLPFLSTPGPVIPKLVNGADLMIPGVVQYSPSLEEEQLVTITQYYNGKIGYAVAVGRMAVSSETLHRADESDVKGKAVYVLHAWKDALWDMGASKAENVPEPRAVLSQDAQGASESPEASKEAQAVAATNDDSTQASFEAADASSSAESSALALTAEDISQYLRLALLQALSTSLSSPLPSAFPISASIFWSSYVLPARPASIPGTRTALNPNVLDVKHSTYKSVKAFLKACAKEGLVKLKDAKGGDVVVSAVFPQHQIVKEHAPFRTIQDVEAKQQKADDKERMEKEAEEKRKSEIQVNELWKPFESTIRWFVAAEKDTSALYTASDIKTTLNAYIASRNLVNAREQQYVNVAEDAALHRAVVNKNEPEEEFLKREDVLTRLRKHMQSWYEIRVEGKDIVRKKGQLKPIHVVVKTRQGRKTCTLITGFEPYLLNGEELAEELRKLCASATSVSAVQGRPNDLEVLVQGKQVKTIVDFLTGKGVPKQWIESTTLSGKKIK